MMIKESSTALETGRVLEQLESDGVAVLPGFIAGEQLAAMQRAFESRLRRLRWNDFDGFEKTERFRDMVQDVLMLDQGFVDTALHPLVKETLSAYIGPRYCLVEAKGWRSRPTRRKFHGWHGDAWYDPKKVAGLPKEVKLAFYLTDVKTGAFQYIKGSHRQHQPRLWRNDELAAFPREQFVEVAGAAGTAFLFDTTGIHGQSSPILEPRNAVFLNYHDPDVPLQQEDIDYYRYHPLHLNAAFLGGLTVEDYRVLGFGHKAHYVPAFEREPRNEVLQRLQRATLETSLFLSDFAGRVRARLQRITGQK
jgi:ectoine hydroxylase-related dioxygenase (phytanoyl-CoA dioxygenase family)